VNNEDIGIDPFENLSASCPFVGTVSNVFWSAECVTGCDSLIGLFGGVT